MKRCLYALLCICGGMLLPFISMAQLTANFNSNVVTGCAPILVQFADQSAGSPTSWNWNLGNGTISTLQNPSTTYITPGTYTVTLTVSNAGGTNTKTVTNYITVVPSPVVNFVASDSGFSCPPETVQFTSLSTPGSAGTSSYFWDFGDGFTSTLQNPTHTYTTNGVYSVTLSVTNSAGCSKTLTKTNYIQLISKPVANFTATNNNSCTLPSSVGFTNSSTGGATYHWNFGDGGTSTITSPTHIYSAAGSYTVTLITTNSAGCSDTMIKPAFVNIGSLTASFTKSASTTCTNNAISFTNTSIPGPGNSTWNFGDGTSFTGVNASHAYSAAGTYTVRLIVNYNNCSDTATQIVTVTQGPSTNFTASPTSSCSAPFTTQFSNTTTGATGYLWIFGDGGTSTATSPSHTYSSLGVYTVKLVAYGANGCNDTFVRNNYINLSLPTVTVSKTQASSCAPSVVNFTANIPAGYSISSYSWNFGDGNTSSSGPTVSHTYGAGTYSVSLTVTTSTGCVITAPAVTVNVGTQPTASFTANPTSACPQQLITFTNTSTIPLGATPVYTWSFGDGATSAVLNPTHAYSAQGTYTATLTVNINGCISTYSSTITIYPPKALFAPVYNCANRLQVSFTNTSTGGNVWAWDFGDGTTSTLQNPPAHTYAAFGTYNVTLTVTNLPSGCISTKTVAVVVYDLIAQFAADDSVVCKNQGVNFTAQSSAHITDYIWDFGDGATQTTATNTTSHAYTANGTYTVTLVVKDARNCYDTLVKANYINVNGPTANFSGAPTSGCAPLTVNFTDQSSSGGTGIFSRIWRFGDGSLSSANVANLLHTYPAGSYSATLVVTNGNGCVDSLVRTNYIAATKPTASFTANTTTICPGQPITFTNSSAGSNLSYTWNFGDGGTSTATNPAHTYSNTGTYTVSLIVVDGTLCRDTLVKTAYINVGGINLGFTASDTFATCPPLTVNFTNTSANASNFTWSFGNGNSSTLPSPSTIYTLPGTYSVKLKGQNGTCMDSVSKTITILGPTGTFSYTPYNGCSPLTVNFTSTNQNTQVLIWDMNNGVTQSTTASSTSYTYTTPGIYVPILLLSDGVSCVVPIQGTDTIKVDKVIGDFFFSPGLICGSGTVQFTDTTLFHVNPVATRSWTFGDGGSSTVHNPSHAYSAPGTYTVRLIMVSSQGCSDTIQKSVTILPQPNVSAGSNVSICQGNSVPVQLQATGAASYVWSPAAGLSCITCPNPQTNPTSTVTYSVIGTAANGCTDTAQVTVTVNPLPVIQTGPDPTICAGSSVQLGVSGAATYSWSPSTGLSCNNCASPFASPTATTMYTVTGVSAAGCSSTAQITVNVDNVPNVAATATNNTLCAGGNTQLQASGATTLSWTPTTGLSCTTCANPTATPTSTTTYVVVGTSGNGCSDTGAVTITVNPLPTVSAGANQSLCIGSTVQLQATGASNYSWSPSTDLSCSSCANPIASPASTTTFTVTGTNANGCVNTSQVTVTVNSLPTITASNAQTACLGTPVPLQVSGASSYTWSPAAGLSCSNCANPTATPSATTSFTVIGSDVNGCKDTAQVIVNVNPLPVVNAGVDRSVCKLNSTQLQATGASTYSWTPASTLSCNSCANPVASPTTNTTYTVTGTDGNGCTNTDDVAVGIYPQPIIDAGTDQTICNGSSVQLQATGGVAYVWSPATSLSCSTCTNPLASPANDITYTVVGTDANGCNDSDKVNISVIQMQPFSVSPGDTLCEGESVQLSASGGSQYIWSPSYGLNNSTISNPVATPSVTTTYEVVIKQGDCFSDTNKVTILVHPKPTVNAGQDQNVIAGSSVNLFAQTTNTDYYAWTPADELSCSDCSSPIATPKQTTTYKVTASNEYGCSADDDVIIFVTCDNSQIFVPNTFTPNGDGNNDRFYPQGKGVSTIQRFRIYNRWGQLVYDVQNIQTNQELEGWDGTYKNEVLKPDVYVYIIDATCYSGAPMQIKGDVSLIR